MDPLIIAGAEALKTITSESLKALSPYLLKMLGISDGNDQAFDQWMKLAGKDRLENLIAEIQRLKEEKCELEIKLTEKEKLSPRSGYNQVLQEYVTTPIEDKLEMLRNALLNGLYGDFSLEMREQFFRWVQALQPVDLVVLKYLYGLCRDMAHYYEIYDSKTGVTRDELWRLSSIGYVSCRGTEGKSVTKEGGLSQFSREEGQSEIVVKQSLDRLRTQGLMHNVMSTFDTRNPYQGCIPTDGASLFLNFISDPRNQLRGKIGG